jgi:hypothetical protein
MPFLFGSPLCQGFQLANTDKNIGTLPHRGFKAANQHQQKNVLLVETLPESG